MLNRHMPSYSGTSVFVSASSFYFVILSILGLYLVFFELIS